MKDDELEELSITHRASESSESRSSPKARRLKMPVRFEEAGAGNPNPKASPTAAFNQMQPKERSNSMPAAKSKDLMKKMRRTFRKASLTAIWAGDRAFGKGHEDVKDVEAVAKELAKSFDSPEGREKAGEELFDWELEEMEEKMASPTGRAQRRDSIREQGDASMYSEANLAKRASLRAAATLLHTRPLRARRYSARPARGGAPPGPRERARSRLAGRPVAAAARVAAAADRPVHPFA